MAQNWMLLAIFIILTYGSITMMIIVVAYARALHLRSAYRQLLTPVIHVEPIPTTIHLDTQELKPVLRKIVSTDINLHIQPDAELDARIKAEIHRHKRNLRRIIDHITSDQIAS
ncbi:MAG: hypothetical protein MUE54_02075 [Anaerolineae bacterium]|jgi:hypothetical protein|nr:hypothetical protein [Anaerolineae bacterium]